jgi:tetratricopeptide (TPR) repeat protein
MTTTRSQRAVGQVSACGGPQPARFGILLLLPFLCAAQSPDFSTLAAQAAQARDAARLDDALTLYRQALALKPGWDEGWWYLGTLSYAANKPQDAIEALRQITKRNPKAGPAYALTGLAEFQLRQYDRALEDLQRARAFGIGEDPKLVTAAQYELAILFNRYRSHDQAYELLKLVVRADPAAPGLSEALGLSTLRLPYLPSETPPETTALVLEAGQAALDAVQSRPREALARYEQLAARYPDAAGVHYAFGLFLLEQDHDRALAEFRRELDINPANTYARL